LTANNSTTSTNGINNTAVGNKSLFSNTIGSFNTALGFNAYPSSNNLNNYTGIGYFVGGGTSNSNMVEIGNTSVTVIRGQVNFTTYSDGRIKKNIKQNVPGLAFINKLKPVTYNLDIHLQNKMLYKDKLNSDANWDEKYEIENITQTGFIAQDVAKAAQETGFDFNGVDKPKNENDLYGLRYAEFVVPLVKAVQELSKENEVLKAENQQTSRALQEIKTQNINLALRLKAIEEKLKE
jgi:trimeric autotransporter adhesin